MSSHALLLRLFLSSSFFSVHVALKYLLLYSDNIGITYYLTRRLRELDVHELRDVWGFICHLLVTRPTKSRALECFVVEIAQRSTHIALITLWFMQANLNDLSSHRDSPSFVICQRVLQKCHEIVFGDQLLPSTSPYSGFILPAYTRRRKIKHHAQPVFVGLGVLLAGAPAMPQLAEITGQVAIEQGRAEEEGEGLRGPEIDEHAPLNSSMRGFPNDDTYESESPPSLDDEPSPPPAKLVRSNSDLGKSSISGRRRNPAAQTLPALPLHLQTIRKSRQSLDPLGQLDSDNTIMPFQSSPSLASARTPLRSATINRADLLLSKYDVQCQTHLLRGHYYSSEVQFLLSLENICNRLVIVPKPARVSALRAELTALNHKLPAEVCMPMWCSSSDSPNPNNGVTEPHHRIVRIPPGEAVVLNSAERAPYLLLIEILTGDLDFDPDKRANKEILRKVVTKEGGQRSTWSDFRLTSNAARKDAESNSDWPARTPQTSMGQSPYMSAVPTTASSSSSALQDEEEIDLVEQLYGEDQPLRSRMVDIEESIVLPPTPKNRELDMATWARSSPIINSEEPRHRQSPQVQHVHTPSISRAQSLSSTQSQFPITESEPPRDLSLDEYSERMRTAAIMLAQLNADQGRESVSNPHRANSASRADSLSDRTGRSGSVEISQPMHTRMRLPRAEASAIRDRIMKEMLALEEERMERMKGSEGEAMMRSSVVSGSSKTAEDEGIIRRELNKVDPSAVVFSESWATKKGRIRQGSPYGHLANWDCVSVIVKTGGDLRQEQLAVQLIREFQCIWAEEKCPCWVKYFRILITGATSGLVETITDAVSIHSIKKAEYAKRLASGRLGHVTLMDHFVSTYGEPQSAKFVRAQKNFSKSLAGYSIVTYLLQVKDRHNGNILIDRDGHLIHIDFGFILSNTPGNIGFEAAPFKLPPEYVEVLGGVTGPAFIEFKTLFRQGFEAARKHCDRIITLVELMQKDSMLPCFAISGEQTANQLRDRFQPTLTHALIGDHINRLIDSSLGSNWTRLYDSYQYYSQSIL
ncbi:Phosphatidylinositol 4-kinase pik1 [Psilocybe cubensis]|uniref:Phosphatidylinositol 4-kinase pik1 n=2 Tax=Psilocybe cubensis TaxID=181762 RepID=A0ACB8H8M6_PSICU|nr:Phosphatidylinositol 4-kinase pik1 [Psilocybe cubensis]KAH9484268.1 Phosphatidylinositol 4-kinase pik1 [Psilocybe cubensis]